MVDRDELRRQKLIEDARIEIAKDLGVIVGQITDEQGPEIHAMLLAEYGGGAGPTYMSALLSEAIRILADYRQGRM